MIRKSTGCSVTSMSASGVRAVLIRLRLASARECRRSRNGRGFGATAAGITGRLVRGELIVVVMLCLLWHALLALASLRCSRSCRHPFLDGRAPGQREEHFVEARQVQ